MEGQNIYLEWTYTLDGTVGSTKLAFVNDEGSEVVIGKRFSPGVMNITSKYQERFKGEATDTRAELTILTVQRSDEETYELDILPTRYGSITEKVTLVVYCKYILKCCWCYVVKHTYIVCFVIVHFYLGK